VSHELKNCPFCGAAAEIGYDAGNETRPQRWWAACTDKIRCGTQDRGFQGSNTWGGLGDLKKMDADAQSNAASHWNRRAGESK